MRKASERLIGAPSGVSIMQRRVLEVESSIALTTKGGDTVTIPAGTKISVLEDVTHKFREDT